MLCPNIAFNVKMQLLPKIDFWSKATASPNRPLSCCIFWLLGICYSWIVIVSVNCIFTEVFSVEECLHLCIYALSSFYKKDFRKIEITNDLAKNSNRSKLAIYKLAIAIWLVRHSFKGGAERTFDCQLLFWKVESCYDNFQ